MAIKGDESDYFYRLLYAQIRYYYKIPHPEDLDDSYVIKLWQDLQWIRTKEKEASLQQK